MGGGCGGGGTNGRLGRLVEEFDIGAGEAEGRVEDDSWVSDMYKRRASTLVSFPEIGNKGRIPGSGARSWVLF